MAKNLDKIGLKSIIKEFDLLFIDIWGVLHDGISLYDQSVEVLNELEKKNIDYILLTNAPRPNDTVIKFLSKMGLDNKKCNKVFTSGEVALKYLKSELQNLKFYHIGPPRDFDLFKLLEKNKVNNIHESDFLLCTGLFENFEDDLNFYKKIFKNCTEKK